MNNPLSSLWERAHKLVSKNSQVPTEAWDDESYNQVFLQIKAQPDDLEAQRIAAKDCNGPRFSIVVPLYNTPRDFLDDVVESVLAQTYPLFELILVNASPELSDLQEWVNQYAELDCRIIPVTLDDNYGITENTNRGIEIATGDFICFMDHDDWIEPDTLFEYAAAIYANNDIDLLYCDEDLVEKQKGTWRFCHPLFKPDYSPELLMCKNYIIHLLAVRKTIVDTLPTPGSVFDGSQDYNMTLAVADAARCVHHVPKVLYHFRMNEGSTAADPAAKPYRIRAARLAIQHHLERTNTQGTIVDSGVVGTHAIWFRPNPEPKVSILVVRTSNSAQSFDSFVKAFRIINTYKNVELFFIGTDSNYVQPDPGEASAHTVVVKEGSNLCEQFNFGAQAATGEILVFLDTNCEFASPEPIQQLVGLLERKGVAIVGPKTLFADHSVKSYGVGISSAGILPLYRGYPLDYPGYQCNMRAMQNVSAISYQGLSIKRELFEKIGSLNTSYSGEIASSLLCFQATQQGGRIVATCTINLVVKEDAPINPFDESSNRPDFPCTEAKRLFIAQPDMKTGTDPYRSPFLDLSSSYPVLSPRASS